MGTEIKDENELANIHGGNDRNPAGNLNAQTGTTTDSMEKYMEEIEKSMEEIEKS